jgi:two-component system phosphate regulon response regulator PhoB
VRGFEVGADDYVTKPFSVQQLLARVAALLLRIRSRHCAPMLKVGDIELDRCAMSVQRQGETLQLGPTDYSLLELFMQSPGRVITCRQLLEGVWGGEPFVDERSIDLLVARLRRVLQQAWRSDPIRIVCGTGYRFEAS